MDELDGAEHALVIDSGKSGDYLKEEVVMGVRACVVGGEDFEDVAIEVECIFEVSDLIFQLIVLLPQHLFHLC